MIGYLKGIIREHTTNSILVLTESGVGYRVLVPTIEQSANEAIELFVHTHVREDAITLYGFHSYEQQLFFEMLLSVSGVGPKSAMTIVAYAPLVTLKEAIIKNDDAFFKHIPGIGRKTAQKIVIECASKLKATASISAMTGRDGQSLVDALTQLGFSNDEITKAIQQAHPAGTLEEQLTQCLQFLTKNE